jgi:predicted RNase H-like HicB family nuclease
MTAVLEKTATGFSAFVEDVPGCVATGATEAEALTALRGALALHFEAMPSAIPLGVHIRYPNGLASYYSPGALPNMVGHQHDGASA